MAGEQDGAWTRAVAEIDLDAIEANVAAIAQRNSGAEVMAMVKADAYGHGLVPVARAAVRAGASWLGVAYADEALALRAAGLTSRILTLVVTPGEDLGPLVERDVDISVSAPWAVAAAVRAARDTGKPAILHLELDTGMTRGGARGDGWLDLVDAALKAQADGHASLTGVWSHLVHDDPRHPFTDEQADRFRDGVERARARGAAPSHIHLAKSTAALHRPDLAFDLVRPGLAVYGLMDGLTPAMTLKARVALTGRVPAGTGVSYGHRHVTSTETGVALVPVGYGDGVPRAGQLTVQLGGRRRPVAGVVCMDQLTVETGDDAVAEGDEVVLFGPGAGGEPTATQWAEATGSIDYEIVTRVGARVPRLYRGGSA